MFLFRKLAVSNLIFLQNALSSCKFLVDTGTSVSVYPRLPCQPCVGVQLRTAVSTAMDTYGSRQLALRFGPCHFSGLFSL